MSWYPVFLALDGKKCLVVGGGKVAERKVGSLLEAGADVTVISPALTKKLSGLAQKGRIRHLERTYRKGDLRGASLAIGATDSESENEKVSKEAADLNIPVNIVDRPALCSFIVPSVIKRGPLVVAVSTSGVSPAMAKSIRKELEALYGPAFARYLKRLAAFRKKILADKTLSPARRRSIFKQAASGDIITSIREGKDHKFPPAT